MSDKLRILPSALAGLLIAVVGFLLAALLTASGFIETTELQGYDFLLSTRRPPPWPQDLVILDFDDRTIDAIGGSPIPRGVLADVLERAASGTPAVIGLDIFLDEKRDRHNDQRLSEALKRAGNVILVENFAGEQLPPSRPLPEFSEQALDVAFVNLPVDADGFIRRIFLWMRTPDYTGLSFPVALTSNYLGKPLQPGRPGTYRLGGIEIPVDGDLPNAALIGHWTAQPAPAVPVWRLLETSFDPQVLRGKLVLIGQSSSRGKDFYPTPVFRFRRLGGGGLMLAGVQIHAAAIATLLQNETVRVLGRRALWPLNFLLICVVSMAVVFLKPQLSIPVVASCAAGVLLLAVFSLSHFGAWIRFASTEAGIFCSFAAGMGYRFVEERRMKTRVESERKRLEQELSLARSIQEGLLPQTLPQLEGLDLFVRHRTSLLVGGDYYDFFQPNATTLLFVVADVEGKGAGSALIMSNVQATLHALLRGPAPSPEWIVATLNDCIIESAHSQKLITMFLGWLDLPSCELRYVNAGHVRPLLSRATGQILSLEEGGLLLGFSPGLSYASGSIRLVAGDVLVAFTDGITEAANPRGEEFGTMRLAATIDNQRGNSAEKIAEEVFAQSEAFSVGGVHEDDRVVMVIKVRQG